MTRIARAAKFALATTGINFTDHSLAHQLFVGSFFNHPDKLVANSSFESGVAARDFQIGVADAGKQHAHERFAVRVGLFNFANRQFLFLDSEGRA